MLMRYFLLLILLPFTLFSQTDFVQLFFKLNVSTLDKSSITKLEQLERKGQAILIKSVTAYTDVSGNDSINIPLAESRRAVVVAYLESLGHKVESSSAPACSYPPKSNRPDDHSYWRRVDIVYEVAPMNSTLEFNGVQLSAKEKLEPIPLTIEFENASPIVREYSIPEMDKLFQFLNAHENVDIFIRGHVCCMDDYDISLARAKALNNYLVRRGISQSRIGFEGYSNTIPLVYPEKTDEDSQRNRRVDIIFTIK